MDTFTQAHESMIRQRIVNMLTGFGYSKKDAIQTADSEIWVQREMGHPDPASAAWSALRRQESPPVSGIFSGDATNAEGASGWDRLGGDLMADLEDSLHYKADREGCIAEAEAATGGLSIEDMTACLDPKIVAKKQRVTIRRAQQIVKKLQEDLASGDDIFLMQHGVTPRKVTADQSKYSAHHRGGGRQQKQPKQTGNQLSIF